MKADHTANFFDNDNASAAKAREGLAEECLENLIRWLKEEGGNVGIHDATNSTIARRKKLYDRVSKEPGLKIVFLESVCTDPKVIAANIAVKVASGDPDYDGIPKELAEKDFRARIKTYEENYQELGITPQEAKLSYCKIIDVGKQVIVNRIDGYLESRVAFCEWYLSPAVLDILLLHSYLELGLADGFLHLYYFLLRYVPCSHHPLAAPQSHDLSASTHHIYRLAPLARTTFFLPLNRPHESAPYTKSNLPHSTW